MAMRTSTTATITKSFPKKKVDANLLHTGRRTAIANNNYIDEILLKTKTKANAKEVKQEKQKKPKSDHNWM